MRMYFACLWMFIACAVAVAAEGPGEFEVAGFRFQRPDDWGWVAPSGMRKAQLSVPGEGGAVADVTFFHFGPGQGGGPEANIRRWVSQFEGGAENAMQKTEQFGKTRTWFVTASGTFQSGMPGGPTTPMEGYALRGAILESPGGDVFVKMTGPAAVVAGAAEAFDRMIETAATSAK